MEQTPNAPLSNAEGIGNTPKTKAKSSEKFVPNTTNSKSFNNTYLSKHSRQLSSTKKVDKKKLAGFSEVA